MAKSKSPKKNPSGNVNGQEANPPAAAALEPTTDLAPVETASLAPAEGLNPRQKTIVRKPTRKPEIVRAESRSNLVPINLEDEIRRLAYLLSERRGFQPGHETEDWLNAEHEVLERYHHQEFATA
jgi:hypothetical protein